MRLKYIAFVLAVLSFVVVAGCTSSSGSSDQTAQPTQNTKTEPIIGTWAGEGSFTTSSNGTSYPYTAKATIDVDSNLTFAMRIDLNINTIIFGDYKTTSLSDGTLTRYNETDKEIYYNIIYNSDVDVTNKTLNLIAYDKRFKAIKADISDGVLVLDKK